MEVFTMSEMQVLGFIPVSYCQKINIGPTEHGIEDYAVFQWVAVNWEGTTVTSRVSRSRIRYNLNGEAYFISEGKRWFFKDAVRNN
jgi:hypothetical protein